ncbi:MAG: nicotinamide-nucleotide adenylyltransferase [Thaumarchaeota archaeon]|nr:MAG: nicotinamide-nucleotide adenylyltransferase [Nitrososphaerota archaeon]TLX91653.1 MAG: nicotinamide-nucleotide adenylyltransferase [Nitrososphaerota archaeon]
MSRGLFIGRFQPFHLGHLASINFAFSKIDELIIIIGSSQASYEMENPFTAGERISMIKESLNADPKIDCKKTLIIPIPDTSVHSTWTHHVDMLVPKYDVVFTNNAFTSFLFLERNITVIEPKLLHRSDLSGTEIRRRMIKNIKWQYLVTEQTLKVIHSINGVDRLKKISNKSHHRKI